MPSRGGSSVSKVFGSSANSRLPFNRHHGPNSHISKVFAKPGQPRQDSTDVPDITSPADLRKFLLKRLTQVGSQRLGTAAAVAVSEIAALPPGGAQARSGPRGAGEGKYCRDSLSARTKSKSILHLG